METKLQAFAKLLQQHQLQELARQGLDCQMNQANAQTKIITGRKYTKVDVGDSGRYMIENTTERIYGIKGYGVIHRGYYFGTLDTISEWFWGGYYAHKLQAA